MPLTTGRSLLYLVVGDANELFLLWRLVLLLPFSSLTSLNVFLVDRLNQFTIPICLAAGISVPTYSGWICSGSILAILKGRFAFLKEDSDWSFRRRLGGYLTVSRQQMCLFQNVKQLLKRIQNENGYSELKSSVKESAFSADKHLFPIKIVSYLTGR